MRKNEEKNQGNFIWKKQKKKYGKKPREKMEKFWMRNREN